MIINIYKYYKIKWKICLISIRTANFNQKIILNLNVNNIIKLLIENNNDNQDDRCNYNEEFQNEF